MYIPSSFRSPISETEVSNFYTPWAQIKETDEPLKEESNTISKPEESQKEHNKCRSEHSPSNQGLGHGCELIITILCDLHCTSETQKSKGYTSGLCKPFDPVCYCKC
uniref:Uncharacterized protein n=1 Tax=Meloidogyne javanica TaxID=6303 RepID=A0A915MJU9_MELJA